MTSILAQVLIYSIIKMLQMLLPKVMATDKNAQVDAHPENTRNNDMHRLTQKNRYRKKKHTLCGLIPAAATYTSSFPMGIPIP